MSAASHTEPPLDTLAPIEPRRAIGIVPNAAHQARVGLIDMGAYQLGVVEFDDQGLCYARAQMRAVADKLDAYMTSENDAILVAFVHGWKHDARTDDDNLVAFQAVLRKTVELEAILSARIGAAAR